MCPRYSGRRGTTCFAIQEAREDQMSQLQNSHSFCPGEEPAHCSPEAGQSANHRPWVQNGHPLACRRGHLSTAPLGAQEPHDHEPPPQQRLRQEACGGAACLGRNRECCHGFCADAGRPGLDIVRGDINMARPPLSSLRYMSLCVRIQSKAT